MKSFRVTRIVTTVQWAHVEADSSEAAVKEATDNPQWQNWETTSENDPIVQDIEENEAECPHCYRTLEDDELKTGECSSDDCLRHDKPEELT